MKKNIFAIILGTVLITAMLGGCGKKEETKIVDNTQTVEEQETVSEEPATEEPVAEKPEKVNISGNYIRTYEEEFDGEVIELTDIIVLNDDFTCEVSFQDTISGTYTDKVISLEDGSEFEFSVSGDELILSRDGLELTFVKTDDVAIEKESEDEIEDDEEDGGLKFAISTTDIDGNPVSLEDFSDAKLIMVNFWEPWCGPCVGEMPDLEKLYEEYKDKGLVILGIFSTTDMVDEAKEVMDSCGTTYPVLVFEDSMTPFITEYVPTTIFINRKGTVLTDEPIIGSNSYDAWKETIEEYMNR